MSQRVHTVKHKRPRHQSLRRKLQRQWPSSKCCGHRGTAIREADQWANEVGEAEDVETAGEDGAGDTVQGGGVPGYLWAVDGEVGGGWTVAALLDENFVGVFWGELLGCDLSVGS